MIGIRSKHLLGMIAAAALSLSAVSAQAAELTDAQVTAKLQRIAADATQATCGWPWRDYSYSPYADVGGPGYGGSSGRPSVAYTKSYRRATGAHVYVTGGYYNNNTYTRPIPGPVLAGQGWGLGHGR